MAIIRSSDPRACFRGKLGGFVFAQQPNGTVIARSVGVRTAKPTEGERKGQGRMKLGHAYVHGVLGDPALRAPYSIRNGNAPHLTV